MPEKGPTLEEVCEEFADCVNRTAPETANGGFFAVGTPAMRGNRIDLSQARQISSNTFQSWTRRLLPQEGDLLLAREAPVGPVVRIPAGERIAAGQRTTHLRPNPDTVDADYLFYLLISETVQSRMMALAMGSTVPHLRVADVRSIQLPPLPPLSEQRAIAEVLGALDEKIAANTRVATTARELMVSLTSLAQGRCELRDVAERVKSSVKPEDLGDAAIDHFSLPAFDADVGPELVRADAIKSNKTAIAQPSVLLSKLNPRIPRVWDVVTVSERPSLGSTEFLVLEPQGVTSSVLWAVLSQPSFWSELSGMVAGTSGSHQRVRPDDVLAVAVIDPRSISEPRRRSITALGERLHHVRAENVALASTRDALLPLLMSGTVTVKDAESVVEGVA